MAGFFLIMITITMIMIISGTPFVPQFDVQSPFTSTQSTHPVWLSISFTLPHYVSSKQCQKERPNPLGLPSEHVNNRFTILVFQAPSPEVLADEQELCVLVVGQTFLPV
jgi:hypothetical protein